MQSFTAKGARANLSWWKVVQARLQFRECLFWGCGHWCCFLYLHILYSNTGDTGSPLQGGGWFCRGLLVKPVLQFRKCLFWGCGHQCHFLYLHILYTNTGDTGSPLQDGGWFCKGLLVKPVCNSGNVYFGIVGIDVVFYICISCIPIRATQGRPYRRGMVL